MANDIIITDGSRAIINDLVIDGVITGDDQTLSASVVQHRTFSGNNIAKSNHIDVAVAVTALNDYADNNWDEKVYNWISSSGSDDDFRTIIYADGATFAAGDPTYTAFGKIDNRSGAASVGDVNMLNANLTGDLHTRGLVLDVDLDISGTGANTGQNVGTTGASDTFTCVIHCTAFSGTTFTVQVEESSDDGSGDAYAQITGTTISAYGNASAGTDDVTFTGTGWAVIRKTGATEAWKRTNITAATMTSSAVTSTAGKQE